MEQSSPGVLHSWGVPDVDVAVGQVLALLDVEGLPAHQHDEQDMLLQRMRKIQPAVKAFAVGACAMSAAILGMYVYDAIRQFYL